MNRSYDENSIEVLDGLEAIRKRPDMYVGSTTGKFSPALYRILREAIDNSLDEYLGGFNNTLILLIDTKNSVYTIIDNGRGIPTGMNEKIGMSAFANVKKLKTITIPKSVNNIEDAAFIKPMKLKGYKKSVAETYAKAYGLKFIKLG